MTTKFRFVCATEGRSAEFLTATALGRSLAIYNAPFAELTLFDENSQGLPVLYNEAIRDSIADPAVLIFVRDDVYLCDFFWHAHLLDGLTRFDVIGIAGNRRRAPRQPTWAFPDERMSWDSPENLSGALGRGDGFPPQVLEHYGPACQEVELLDGLLLAVRSETLLEHQILFDEQFDCHFHDMDFCRQARDRGLKLGTWTLSVIQQSPPQAASTAWREGYARYLEKWRA